MKKKILLTLVVIAMLVFAFAVSVGAITPNNEGEVFVTADETTLALYDTEGKALAWFYDSDTGEYVAYRVEIDFTCNLASGRELRADKPEIYDTDNDSTTSFPYSLSDMVVLNGRDYDAFTYISGTWSNMPLQAIYVNDTFRWINKTSFNGNNTLKVFHIPKTHTGTLHIGAAFVKANALESFYVPKDAYFESTSTFENSTKLKSVEFHNDWTGALKGYEFNGCTSLESVKLADTVTSIPTKLFYNCSSLSFVNIPSKVTAIGQSAFQKCTALTQITIPAGFTVIDQYAFCECTSLTSVTFMGNAAENATINQAAFEKSGPIEEFCIPEGVVALGNCLFNQAGVKRLSFPSTLTTISGNSNFEGKALVSVTGFENTKITTIPNDMFKGQSNWKADVVRIPDTVTSIGMYGMADVGATKFILGTGMQTIGTEAFVNCPNVKEIYIPDTVTSITSNAFNNNKTSNILFFVTSSDSDYLSLVQTGVKANAANIVSYADYSANPSNYLNKGRYVISGVNKCVAFYEGKHTLDASQSGLSYPNGFDNKGVYSSYCTKCEESLNEEKNALLVIYGTSVPEYVGNGISIGFEVDKAAIKEYEDATNTTVIYGLFAVLQVRLGENDVFNSDGTATEGVMYKEATGLSNTKFAIKIVGFKTEEHKAAKLAMGAYLAVVTDGVGEYHYMQGGTPDEGEKYYFVSYNDVVADAVTE